MGSTWREKLGFLVDLVGGSLSYEIERGPILLFTRVHLLGAHVLGLKYSLHLFFTVAIELNSLNSPPPPRATDSFIPSLSVYRVPTVCQPLYWVLGLQT